MCRARSGSARSPLNAVQRCHQDLAVLQAREEAHTEPRVSRPPWLDKTLRFDLAPLCALSESSSHIPSRGQVWLP